MEENEFKRIMGVDKEYIINSSKKIISKTRAGLSRVEQSLIFFFWLRNYLPLKLMAVFLCQSESTVRRILFDLLDHFDQQTNINPTFSTNSGVSICGRQIHLVLDGSEQEIKRSKKTIWECRTYSGKKGQNSINIIIIVDHSGRIVYISDSYPGATNDAEIYQKEKEKIKSLFGETIYFLGDQGFTGVEEIITIQRGNSLFSYHSQKRVIVERVFSSIKKWKVCSTKLREFPNESILNFHQKIWKIVCDLVNKFVQHYS